ncbi:MAG TPA: hypothetical protein VNA88_13920 [Candidatus Kapabacteria bacterium]|jgi:hypothetical protein|nr:hypothetical protein [Candidatus Kapabacteria bacterium]
MQRTPLFTIAIIAAAMTLSGCEMIGDILQAGIWMGIILVVIVIAIIYWLYRKFSGRR